jgi:serine protease Do
MSFADIFDRVSPAVVSINVTATVDRRALQGLPGFEDAPGQPRRTPQPRGRAPDGQDDEGQGGEDPNTTQAMASGSGFFISPDGYIVTNNHVIENAKDIKVVLAGKEQREYPAKVIGHDEGTDLAVLKIEGKDFPYVSFENSSRPRVGDWVIAVGNPFGLGGTATAGIISAYGRDIGEKFVDYIQIDAPINRGNSGGPTFDMYGRVIGINTAIFSPSGGSVGIGFAIPADIADTITKQLISGGKITRGYLGATIQDVSPEIADSLGRPDMKGALVDELVTGGPAEKSGLEPGDVVISVNGTTVRGATGLTRQVASSHTGDILHLSVLRDGQPKTIDVRSGMRPSEAELERAQGGKGDEGLGPDGKSPAQPNVLGMVVGPLDAAVRGRFGVPGDIHGAVIEELSPTSDAAKKGLKPGDVVIRVNDKPVTNGADIALAVDAAKKAGRANVLLFIYRDHHQLGVPIKIAPEKDEDASKGPGAGKVKPKGK